MPNYAWMYRLGLTPWERYGRESAASFAETFDGVSTGRPSPPGRALDLGCGRGLFTPELARRGWETVGIDLVPRAIEAAKQQGDESIQYVVGDVTELSTLSLGTFDLFVDIGCFQGLDERQRRAMGSGVSVLANPSAVLLLLAFGPTRLRSSIGGVSRDEVDAAFSDWETLDVWPAPTAGLGWPMNRTSPQWYRMAYAPE
ncbi:MAG: class I SAM-dependent methyltransferase [Microcella sp.]|uniref:class I SAM-dependent methyltransferase n=1 Tax=Microcella sp. TaxID=1913979 RepID=UPI0024C9728D|nr:class I SAM-dependent methyltransferase [Microcella sp.]UYN84449.1 MAG: class I SAM-dependent methyltransferase [Microcella sp.]